MSFSLLYAAFSFILSNGSQTNVSNFDFLVTALVDFEIAVIIVFILHLLLTSDLFININNELEVKVMIGTLILYDADGVCVKGSFWWYIIIPDMHNN